jgi:hypothetical protein
MIAPSDSRQLLMFCEEMVKIMSSIVRFGMIAVLMGLLTGQPGLAGALENGHFVFDTATGFAADGYDPVAYFVDRTLREGKADYETIWDEVGWRFVNEGNRDAFVRNPYVYAPAYGGRCPVAMAQGHPAEGDPRLWAIYNDRLYFFYSRENMQAFTEEPARIVAEAQASWDRLYPY